MAKSCSRDRGPGVGIGSTMSSKGTEPRGLLKVLSDDVYSCLDDVVKMIGAVYRMCVNNTETGRMGRLNRRNVS